MDESSLRSSISQKLSAVRSQGSVVRSLKDAKAPKSEIDAAVLALDALKLEKSIIEKQLQASISESGTSTSLSKEAFRKAVLMVKDEKTGNNCHRADHLVKDHCNEKLEKDHSITPEKVTELKHVLATLDDLSQADLGAKIKEYGIVAPDTKNPLSDPFPFNLMFQTAIGPSGLSPGYMRPETAQGIFVNFKDFV